MSMSTLLELLTEHTDLPLDDVAHLQRLVGEWQLLSDLSFADLLLWVPVGDGEQFLCVAQVRPTTGPTAYQDDHVGQRQQAPEATPQLVAMQEGRIFREGDPEWEGAVAVRREAIPVRRPGQDRPVAVVGRDTNLVATRGPSKLELAYLNAANDLCRMVCEGTFPPAGPDEVDTGPRAGDGLIRLDADGRVVYASPNAQSAYRRLGVTGDLLDGELAPMTRALTRDALEGSDVAGRIKAALSGEAPARMELEARGATVLFRVLPLYPEGTAEGALVLVGDVTEVRNRDRQLLSKDATIREIHHRVKNNLQTVAALLRLQARRVESPDARTALEESVRRVASIAMVHETLAVSLDERVDFDGIVDRLLSSLSDVAGAGTRVRLERTGSFGILVADVATPLVMVLTELVQNAVEHGFPDSDTGTITVTAFRLGRRMSVVVSDDGTGLPDGFSLDTSDRLGLQIVRTLVTAELGGSIEVRRRGRSRGAEAVLDVPVTRRR
jgi:two-component system, sensor histidine kinase PdtaS